MNDNPGEIRSIAWSHAFPFVRLFHTFRLAMDFKRLVLALAAVVIVYLAGRLLDVAWRTGGGGVLVNARSMADVETDATPPTVTEIEVFATRPHDHFAAWYARTTADRDDAVRVLIATGAVAEPGGAAKLTGRNLESLPLTSAYRDQLSRASKLVADRLQQARTALAALPAAEKKRERAALNRAADTLRLVLATGGYRWLPEHARIDEAIERIVGVGQKSSSGLPESDSDAASLRRVVDTQLTLHATQSLHVRGPFRALLAFQSQCFAGAVQGVVSGRWGYGDGPSGVEPSLLGSVGAFTSSLTWAVTQRPWYTLLMGVICVVVFGFFGGAICRSAAIQSAREESIPIRDALGYARSKFTGLLTAPLMPLAIFVGILAIMWIGGLVGAIPRLGELLAGITFPLAVLGGFALAMIFIATVLGFFLMWPTIAVEGSDGFDALSRVGNYLGGRLWSVSFYTFLLLLYGGLSFVVVRAIAQLTLKFTHWGTGLGLNLGSNVALDGLGKLNGIWRMPAWSDLAILPSVGEVPFWGTFHNAPLNWSEWIALVLIAVSVFVVVGLVGAFVVSFFFCGSTQMYFLLRREVDATDFDEVFFVEPEPEPATATAPPTQPAPPAGAAPAADTAAGGPPPAG